MLTARLNTPLLLLLLLALPAKAGAQDSLLLRDYQFVRQQDAWLTSMNAAALTRLAAPSIAQATLSLRGGRGDFTNYSQSPSTVQASAAAESFYRLGSRAVVFGSMSYAGTSGKEMGGSVFISPERKPFDIVEDSLTNLGRKHLDTYRLTGAVGLDVVRGLAAGLRLDYTAANYAKYKDLRHKNKLLDMVLTAGVCADVAPWLAVGGHYLYRRAIESVSFGTYGKDEKVYKSLISYAAFTGHVEQYGNYGYTDKAHEMPLADDYNGLGVQIDVHPWHGVQLWGEAGYARREGYYGRKSPYTITYTQHASNCHTYQARLSLFRRAQRHRLQLAIETENLVNEANTYRELINDAGATYYEYYTPVKTANKAWATYSLGYTAELDIRGELPVWALSVQAERTRREQTAYVYPYYRHQQLRSDRLTATVAHRIVGQKGVWTLQAGATLGQGGDAPYEDLTFAPPSDKQQPPPATDYWLQREYRYLTAAQYGVEGSAGYAFVWPGTRLKTSIAIEASHRKANESTPYPDGCDFTQAALTVGCTF